VPVPTPRNNLDFAAFQGPTAAFPLEHGVFEFTFTAVTLGDLYLEAETAPGTWAALRVLNTHTPEATVSAVLGPGAAYRLNNQGPGAASVTISGPE
jgi:hypothetical protein